MTTWNEEDHPRDPAGTPTGGRFTPKESVAGGTESERFISEEGAEKVARAARRAAGLSEEDAKRLIGVLHTDGGFSESLKGVSPKSGYMVAISPEFEMKVPLKDLTTRDLIDYTNKHSGLLEADNIYLGGWVDDGFAYIDISINVQDLDQALALARKNNQLAIYDIATGESIYLKERQDE